MRLKENENENEKKTVSNSICENHRQFVSTMLSIRPFNQLDSQSFFMVGQLIFHWHTQTHSNIYYTPAAACTDTTPTHSNWYYVLRFILTEDVKKYRVVTNFIVEMESLNGNLAIFHMQNKSKKMYMAKANAIAVAHSVWIEISAMLYGLCWQTTQHGYVGVWMCFVLCKH